MTDKKEAQPEALRLADALAQADRAEAAAINYGEGTTLGIEAYASAKTIRAQHAEIQQLKDQLADETESASEWRRLALQFDGHRMQALSHLRLLTKHPSDHCAAAVNFLAAPPLSGEQVLADRLAQLSARQAAPDAIGHVRIESGEVHIYPRNRDADSSGLVDGQLVYAAAPPPPEREPLTEEQIIQWWASENGLEDCDMAVREDFVSVVHAVQARLGITTRNRSHQ